MNATTLVQKLWNYCNILRDFNSAYPKEGLHCVVNKLSPSASPRLRVNQMPLP